MDNSPQLSTVLPIGLGPDPLDVGDPMTDNADVRRALPFVVYPVFAAVLTWPSLLHPIAAVPGQARTDLWDSLWSLWYFQQRLFAGSLPISVDGLLNHPDGGTLWVADPVNALLAAPLIPLLGVAATWTLLVNAHVAFAGIVAHRLGEAVGGNGWAAGFSYAGAPMLLAHIHNGASEAVGTGWLALAALALVRLAADPSRRRLVFASAALGVCAVAHWYAGVDAYLLLAVMLIFGPARRWLFAAAFGGALLAAPVAVFARAEATATENVVSIKEAREVATVRRTIGPADPVAFVMPGDYRSPDFRELSRYGEEYIHCPYLGWVLLFSATSTLFGARRRGTAVWWFAGLAAALLACGPVLARFGAPVIFPGRLAVPLPYLLLEKLPAFSSLSLLWRLAQLTTLSLSVIASRLTVRWGVVVGILAVAEAVFASPMHAGMGHVDARIDNAIVGLRGESDGALMNFPVVGGRAYLYEQTAHRKPLTAGLNFPNNNASRRVWKAILDHQHDSADDLLTALSAAARKEGVRYLVVHVDPMAHPDMHDTAVSALKAATLPIADDGAVRVYRLY